MIARGSPHPARARRPVCRSVGSHRLSNFPHGHSDRTGAAHVGHVAQNDASGLDSGDHAVRGPLAGQVQGTIRTQVSAPPFRAQARQHRAARHTASTHLQAHFSSHTTPASHFRVLACQLRSEGSDRSAARGGGEEGCPTASSRANAIAMERCVRRAGAWRVLVARGACGRAR